jgi:cadmium resistance protein CadD (predicted permease)
MESFLILRWYVQLPLVFKRSTVIKYSRTDHQEQLEAALIIRMCLVVEVSVRKVANCFAGQLLISANHHSNAVVDCLYSCFTKRWILRIWGFIPVRLFRTGHSKQSNNDDDYRAQTGLNKQDIAAKEKDQYRQYQRQPLNRP